METRGYVAGETFGMGGGFAIDFGEMGAHAARLRVERCCAAAGAGLKAAFLGGLCPNPALAALRSQGERGRLQVALYQS